MLASLFARTSQGISYPNLYRNSAASLLARLIDALPSAIEPVTAQPTEGEILKTCDTDEGSISLSCKTSSVCQLRKQTNCSPNTNTTYRYFLLRQYDSAVFASDPKRCDVGGCDCLESVFCCNERVRFNFSTGVGNTNQLGTTFPGLRRL